MSVSMFQCMIGSSFLTLLFKVFFDDCEMKCDFCELKLLPFTGPTWKCETDDEEGCRIRTFSCIAN